MPDIGSAGSDLADGWQVRVSSASCKVARAVVRRYPPAVPFTGRYAHVGDFACIDS